MPSTGIQKPLRGNLSENEQFPLNVMGPKGPHSFMGSARALFQGLTGLVATAYGIPGVTIGRIRTGVYGVVHDPINDLEVWPSIQAPSGLGFDVALKGISGNAQYDGRSGYFEVHLTRPELAPVVTGTNPSTLMQPQNPPSGAALNLLWFGSPSRSVGY